MKRGNLFIEYLEDRRVLSADFNGNGTIDVPDLANWKTGFGTVGAATKPQGDYDVDRNVDGADFLAWQRTLGQIVPSGTFIDISIDELNEANETAPGAIVFRNSDFSKQSLAATQPEAGLPLYVPDYSAPASIYDPNAGADFTWATVDMGAAMVGQYTMRFTYDTTKIQIWTSFNWTGFQAVGGRFKIPSGVIVTPATQAMSFQIEGLQKSTAFSTDSIQVQAIPNGVGATLTDQGDYTVVEVNAGVDGNRDTAIDFANSHDRQLLFWVNNDQEGFHPTDTTVESEVVNVTDPDDGNNVIDGRRDLEDLAPVRFQVDPLLFNNSVDIKIGAQTPGQLSARYSLDFLGSDGESFRLFFSNNTQVDVTRHVSNVSVADVQANDPFFQFSPPLGGGGAFTGNSILQRITAGLNSHIFEIRHGALPYGAAFENEPTLTFVTEVFYPDGSKSEKRHEIDLDIRDIKSFYTRWDIPYANDLRTNVSFEHFATPSSPTHSSQVMNVPFFSGDDTIVLVHGWNMTDTANNDWKAAFAETMFKRLYWQGYRGEFVAFNWPTFADSEGPREWPIVEEGANITYNPSDFQAYRSAKALREVLEGYRGESPNLQPVHLLAHSMGNVVAGEALRLYTFDPDTEEPLVTDYVAMEAAVSAGAYGNNAIDSDLGERPDTDLYRFWQHGRDGFSDPGLGITPYFSATAFASERRINFYNQNDFALDRWDTNNTIAKDPLLLLQSTVWPYDYEYEAGDGGNTNTDIFTRVPDVGAEVVLDLALPNGRPGPNAYEILAFFAQSASLALGTKEVTAFDENIDLESYGMPGGSGLRAQHSYQFNHDAAETWGFYNRLKMELGFDTTYSLPAIVGNSIAAVKTNAEDQIATSNKRLDWFLEPIAEPAEVVRATRRGMPIASAEPTLLASRRSAVVDAYFESRATAEAAELLSEPDLTPAHVVPETLDIVFEKLRRSIA